MPEALPDPQREPPASQVSRTISQGQTQPAPVRFITRQAKTQTGGVIEATHQNPLPRQTRLDPLRLRGHNPLKERCPARWRQTVAL